MEVNNIKIAFGSVPKDSGTFTFYRNLRPALQKYGIDLRCVTVGKREARLIEDKYIDDGCILLAPETDNVKKQAQVFTQWCEQEKVNIVMAINSVAILSALPHLPKHIRVLSRCANGFDEGYRVTLSGQERLMGIVALTPRLKNDLVEKYGANPHMIHLIPNGIDPVPFEDAVARGKASHSSLPIKLGFMGRLEHNQKGVLYLPEIVRELKRLEVPFHLRIAGKGVHRSILEKELKPYIESGEVELIGAISKDKVPEFLKTTDVFLFTSHFEGCPNALLEAMMAGCAPVAFLIDGITNFVLDDGETGFIAPMADCKAFARYVDQMVNNPELLHRISKATMAAARERFVAPVAANKYAWLFHEVMQAPLPNFEPLRWSQFKVDPVYQKRWTAYFPEPMKKFAKSIVPVRGLTLR